MTSSTRQLIAWLAIAASVLTAPLLWRGALAAWGPDASRRIPSYLPALETSRERAPFDPEPIDGLKRIAPGYAIIGDSMAGRIHPDRLAELSGTPVAPVLQNASGSAYWYLVFKNYMVASGIHPHRIIVVFRDTNLTDVLFRIDGPYRGALDPVALDREEELNRVVAARTATSWYRAHMWLDALYDVERTRAWIEPKLTVWPAAIVKGSAGEDQILSRVNATFALDNLRVMPAADITAAEEREMDFAGTVDDSVLPLFLSLAREHGLRLCFVRVLRRPENGQPQAEPPALQRYMKDLRAYLTAHGADFIDDRDDPALWALPYADGDHTAREARVPYTERFWEKIRTLRP